nr:unnamed protein product [Digitaria exilis]
MAMEVELQNGNKHVAESTTSQKEPHQQGDQIPINLEEAELVWKLRKYLILLAILSATITYQAGLAPPGGLWLDNLHGHLASDIVLQSTYSKRYNVFFYCNSTAFMASLIVLILLLVRELSRNAIWLRSLHFAMLLNLLGLMGAYAAGSCRQIKTSLYTWVLLVGIFTYVVLHVVFFQHLASEWLRQTLMDVQRSWKDYLARMFGKNHSTTEELDASVKEKKDELEQKRSLLLVLATLSTTVTYAAGLNPPGGFWPDSDASHLAGDPVLRDHYPRRFKAFMACNDTAFAGSLVIIIMLLSNTAVDHVVKSNALRICVVISLFGLMAAYAAGSCREVHTSIYVFTLVGAVLLYLVIQWIAPIVPRPEFVRKNSDESAQQIHDNPELKDLEKRRKFLVLLAVLAASSTYQAGMNPPGGFWTDNNDGHRAGYPMFHDEFPHRYMVFFYLNSTAFMSSLAVIMLLVSKRLCQRGIDGYLLRGCMLIDLVSLMGAFAAGSCRKVSISVYAILVVAIVFAYVMAQVLVLTFAKDKVGYFFEWVLCATPFKSLHPSENCKRGSMISRKLEHKWRKDLILIGTLAVSVTYQAGLLPPGGLWPDDRDGHFIGDPILHDTDPPRYKAFFYCNATAFMASLVIVILLLNNTISKYKRSLLPMKTAMVLDLLALLGAYASGSCRKLKTSIYIFALFIAVFMYVVIHIFLSFNKMAQLVKKTGERWIPCLNKIWALIEIEPPNHPPFNEEP